MKNLLYSIVLLAIFMLTGCDNLDTAISTPQSISNQELLNRLPDDCTPCPAEHCCCAIEYLDFGPATLHLCGVYNPVFGSTCGTFNPGSPCSNISGTTLSLSLGSMNPREVFCVPIGDSFRIFNFSGGTIRFRLTCQNDLIDPDWGTYELDNGESLFFASDGDCFLVGC